MVTVASAIPRIPIAGIIPNPYKKRGSRTKFIKKPTISAFR